MSITAFISIVLLSASVALAQRATGAVGCNQRCGFGVQCSEGVCSDGVCECRSLYGDPELIGLDGRNFFFDGEAGYHFNLISERHHQVNALFVEGPHKIAVLGSETETHNGTYVSSMGFKMNGERLQVHTDYEGAMTVVINGEPVLLTQQNNFEDARTFDKLKVITHKYRAGFGETVHLISDLFDFLVSAAPSAWDEETRQMNRGHLNLGMGVNDATYFSRTIHGVLGQISPDSYPDVNALPQELREAFLGEGVESDYKVSGLFEDDFRFNLYEGPHGVSQATKPAVSRRLLASDHARWLPLGLFGSG